jgi:hypothetical protein
MGKVDLLKNVSKVDLLQTRAEQLLKDSAALPSQISDYTYSSDINLEDAIMRTISRADFESRYQLDDSALEGPVISLRSWVLAGLFIMLSLPSAFFGVDFIKVVNIYGSSFLLPVALTIGAVVTLYGALFIATHVNELSEKFGVENFKGDI